MKVYFNSIGEFLNKDTSNDLFVKGNIGNVIQAYFKDLDFSDANIVFRLIIKWSDGTTTNELPMSKSITNEYVYLALPTLKEGNTQFTIRIYNYGVIQHTAIFNQVVLNSVDASDDTIDEEEYQTLLSKFDGYEKELLELAEDVNGAVEKVDTIENAVVENTKEIANKANTSYVDSEIEETQRMINQVNSNFGLIISELLDSTIPSLENELDTKATYEYVNQKVADIINSSPEALDTLYELARALNNDPNFATTIANQIGLKANKAEVDSLRTTLQSAITNNFNKINNLSNSVNNDIKKLENEKQEKLISGVNVKTINGYSILGQGDIPISGGGSGGQSGNYVSYDEFNNFKNDVNKEFSNVTTKVTCDHRYEITGATGDEHNLAIEDQQMLINKISGRTLVKNQLIDLSNNPTRIVGGITFTNNGDGSFTLNGTTSDTLYFDMQYVLNCQNHKFFMPPSSFNQDETGIVYYINEPYTYWAKYNLIVNVNAQNQPLYFYLSAGKTYNNDVFRPQLIDLTQAYGPGKEPTTVEEVLNDLPEYIPYNEGEFVHSNNKLVSTGRNIWNEKVIYNESVDINNGTFFVVEGYFRSADFIKVFENTDYYLKNNSNINIVFYDSNKKYISTIVNNANIKFTTPLNCKYITFSTQGTTYNNDICINVSDTNFNGTYEPYKEEVVEVGELKQFDYIDNDSDEKEIETGLIDLGNLDFKYSDYNIFFAEVPNLKKPSSYDDRNKGILSTKYPPSKNITIDNNMDDIAMLRYLNSIYIRDSSYTDVTTFKEAMKGVMLAYELETPIVEPSNLPAGMAVYKGGLQKQKGTIPYVIEKQYALSIASQVLQNIEIDREQQEQLNNKIDKPKDGNEIKLIKDNESSMFYVNKILDDGLYTLTFDGKKQICNTFYLKNNSYIPIVALVNEDDNQGVQCYLTTIIYQDMNITEIAFSEDLELVKVLNITDPYLNIYIKKLF